MKKLLSLIVSSALMCLVMLTGCKPAGTYESTAASVPSSDDFTVGVIYIGSRNDTSGYTYAHHQGLVNAMEDLGLSSASDLKIRDRVPGEEIPVREAVEELAVQGCDIIFGISYGYAYAFAESAEEYPDIVFCNATGYLSNDTNFINYSGRIYQSYYLSGIAAGYKTLQNGNNDIGFVSSWGTEVTESASAVNAFALGAQAVNPDVVLHVYEIETWDDEDMQRQAAETLISRYGCCVIAQDCDSSVPQTVASEQGVFGCGYNSDMSADAPESHLTAPVWNWAVFYKTAIQTAMNGSSDFAVNMGGNYYGGLNEGMVDIAPLTGNNAPQTAEAIGLVRDIILSGEWDVFSGTALVITGAEGDVTVTQTPSELTDSEGEIIVEAGEPSLDDRIIRGSMHYYVDGVEVIS